MSGFFSVPTKEEDQASANADLGYPVQAVRKATPANTSGTDGDYEFLQMVNGRLWVNPGSDADNSSNSTTKLPVLSARANAAAPAWTEGNQVPLSTDLAGAVRVTITNLPRYPFL